MSLRGGLGSTYRLQLRPGWGFAEAAGVVAYLAHLGVETVYCSPIAEAVPGSQHGYDGTDPTQLRAELGGIAAYRLLVDACERHGLGICVDIVPNHLATWHGGAWWRRLLAEGRHSPMAEVFDVDWEAGGGKVVLPILDRPLHTALADGMLHLRERDGAPVIALGDDGGVDLPVSGGGTSTDDDVGDVLDAQHYRLADWHDTRARNYRRFFDIDGLVGVRVEDASVFERTHALVVELAGAGQLSALRVDHVDGLREPTVYLRRLSRATGVPIVVEKILTGDERLRPDWPVVGTTGYEVIDDVGGVLVDAAGLDRLVAAGRADGDGQVAPLTVDTRALVLGASFPAEAQRAATGLGVDEAALGDVLVRLPRYRTYLAEIDAAASEEAEAEAVAVWRAAAGDDPARHQVVATVLDPEHRQTTLRLQQLTGALMAKGIEDTAWYRLSGPLAFCEVGGDPALERHGAVQRWHARSLARVGASGLVPGTTHDTKRSHDVRCRLYALSERVDDFEDGLRRMRAALGLPFDGGELAFETRVISQVLLGVLPPLGSRALGAPATEHGSGDAGWHDGDPLASRVRAALVKGAREAKVRSSWQHPDEGYEATLGQLADAALAEDAAVLRESFGPLVDDVARLGAVNVLGAVVLRHTAPGVPDCYQGDEAWNLSLVDPDNRRPVDFARLAAAMSELSGAGCPLSPASGAPGGAAREGAVGDLRRSWRDGRVKLWVTHRCLLARRDVAPAALSPAGGYRPLQADGASAGSVLAFERTPPRRRGGGPRVVVVVTRRAGTIATRQGPGDDLPSGSVYGGTSIQLGDGWTGRFEDALSGHLVDSAHGAVAVAEALASLPVALLVEQE